MANKFDAQKYARRLEARADELTNENYHTEAATVSAIAEFLRNNLNAAPEDLLPLVLDEILTLGD